MRKYNGKTKKTMIIILILFVGIVIIFSLFLKKAIDVGKTVYKVGINSILFDNQQNMIKTTEEGTIRIKWGGDYYLLYNDKEYDLGTHAVVYHTDNGNITLYGKYYEVNSDGDVNVVKGENLIKSSVNSRFYKLSDRKYLIVDRTIESKSSSFVTSNYLLVNLDKLGNATLLNDKTSYKTIVPTILRTAGYSFDIANEKLNFGGEDIDLKKIIGSTNEYDEETYNLNATKHDDELDDGFGNGSGTSGTGTGGGAGNGSGTGTGDGTGTGNGTGTGDGSGNGSGSGSGGSNGDGTTAASVSEYSTNYSSAVSDEAVEEIVNATRNTSVIRISPGIDTISIDYVVYDPKGEYRSVYLEIENTDTSKVNTIYLSKTDTNIVVRDLKPNVYYNLLFKYTYYDEESNLREYVFDSVGTKTVIPEVTLSVIKIVDNKLYYKLSFDRNYTITGGTIDLLADGIYTDLSVSIPTFGNVSSVSGENCYLDISGLNFSPGGNKLLSLKVSSLSFNTYTVKPSVSYNFRY